MAQNLLHLSQQIAAKPGYVVSVDLKKGHLTVTKANGQAFAARVIHNDSTGVVTVGDGSGVKTGHADAWLQELK